MTGTAYLFNLDQKRIAVTIGRDLFNLLNMARGFSFDPVRVSRPGIKTGLSNFQHFFYGGLIHIGQHEYFMVFVVLDNRRHKPIVIEFKLNHAFLSVSRTEIPFRVK